MGSSRLEQVAPDLVLDGRVVGYVRFERLAAENLLEEGGDRFRLVFEVLVCGQTQRLGQVTLADRSFGQRPLDFLEVELESCIVRTKYVVQLAAHRFDLSVRLGTHRGQLRGVRLGQFDRIGEALAAEVGAARIVRVVDPYAGGLILLLEADELDVEQREQLPAAASVVPLLVAVHRIEVVDADDADVFGHGPVERVGQLVERAERVGRMQMGVDIDRLDLVSFR